MPNFYTYKSKIIILVIMFGLHRDTVSEALSDWVNMYVG